LNQLCDSIFLAKKNTLLTLYTTALYTIIKVALPLIFFDLGALGILLAVSVAQLIGLFVNLYFLQRKWQYFSHVTISLQSATSIWKFTFHNYLAGILSLLPYAIVPIIIINKIGVHEVAYYYIVAMIANLMYTISGATTKSLFTEGVHNHEILHEIVKKSFYFISLLLLPAILVIFIIGKFLLGFFGPEYATNGLLILKILALSTIPYSLHSIFVSIFKIKNMSWALLISTAVLSLSEVVLAYYLAVYGLTGIGMATFLSMLLASIVSFGFILNLKFSDK
jgi:O-antigen/teichoic acid export membrane protein